MSPTLRHTAIMLGFLFTASLAVLPGCSFKASASAGSANAGSGGSGASSKPNAGSGSSGKSVAKSDGSGSDGGDADAGSGSGSGSGSSVGGSASDDLAAPEAKKPGRADRPEDCVPGQAKGHLDSKAQGEAKGHDRQPCEDQPDAKPDDRKPSDTGGDKSGKVVR